MTSPSHTYYRGAQGRWRGEMNARVTDVRALLGAMGLMNGASALMMAWWPWWLGRLELETTVSYGPQARVRHTTTIYWFFVPMMRSVEHLTLLEDGARFTLTGESCISLMPWRRVTLRGAGEVDPSARHATYTLEWMGTEFTQTTTRRDDGVTLQQEAPGFVATQTLSAPGA